MNHRHASILEAVPLHVRERVRVEANEPGFDAEAVPPGPVVWWVHHAMRVEENPALEVAVALARMWNRPLLPIAVVGGRHPFNNDRHLTFAIEGLRDLQRQLRERGLDLAVVVRGSCDRSPVAAVASTAACVVTEAMPAPPWPRWIASMARTAGGRLLEVDASCLVPIFRSRKAPDRAFAFRDRFASERAAALRVAWPTADLSGVGLGPLPEGAIDLARISIPELVGSLEIDHTVAPVFDTPGGTEAAMARWSAFRRAGLRRYARDRNDAAIDATSRMSAYLLYGMASPFRVAREASEDGAEKYLDELLVWRELAWHWAACTENPESFGSLPTWAQRTLEAHRGDRRERIGDEPLERAASGDELWDLAQRSLLRHGELHNNLRMTWGKAIPWWSASPEESVTRLFELNHRFALDGCDPSSAGGLLWCLGLFDRPFEPEQPVLGTIRGRSLAEHAARLDLARYRKRVDRPQRKSACGDRLRVAVIGAGLAGLVAARTLVDHGLEVEVFDKGRGPGGRASTRRDGELRFDHGAPGFTVRDPRVQRMVTRWSDAGVVSAWKFKAATVRGEAIESVEIREAWTGVGGMNAIAKHLASDLALRCGARIERVEPDPGSGAPRWTLSSERGSHGPYDAVLVATPPSQAADLLGPVAERWSDGVAGEIAAIRGLAMEPSWVAMVRMQGALTSDLSWLEIEGGEAVRIACEQSVKPGRGLQADESSWVLEASPVWSRSHLELKAEDVAERAGDAWRRLVSALDLPVGEIVSIAAHRWRYARAPQAIESGTGCRSLLEDGLVLGGDWSHAGTSGVERAILAGEAMAGRILRSPRFKAESTALRSEPLPLFD